MDLNGHLKRNNMAKQKYKEPRWLKSIPTGSHGTASRPITKRYWKLVSDYTRIHDWYKYNGKCVSCDRVLANWQEGQAAHWKSWGASNSWGKYNLDNIALSCSHCNHIDDGQIGYTFGEVLKSRKGKDILDKIQKYDNEQRGKKMESWDMEKRMLELIEKMKALPEYPSYIDMAESYNTEKTD